MFAVKEAAAVPWNLQQDVDLRWTMDMITTILQSRMIHMDHHAEVRVHHHQAQADIQARVNQ